MTKPMTLSLTLLIAFSSSASAQLPQPTEEHKVLKMEEGKWKATTKLFFGPAGPIDEPFVSEGSEVNKMLGGFWVVSEFKGNFGGMPFEGMGTFGYDAKTKKHIGMWVDSTSGNATKMEGSFDKEKNMMVYMTTGIGMDGKPSKGKNVVSYEGSDKKKMTMYSTFPGSDEMVKVMEIDYVREKGNK